MPAVDRAPLTIRRDRRVAFAYALMVAFAACTFPEVTIADAACVADEDCPDQLRCASDGACVACLTSDHCPATTVCTADGTCGQCADDGDCTAPQICDTGQSTCVDCLGEGGCTGEDICANGVCAPMECANGIQDGDEVATDCGGPSCAGCSVGTACTAPDDCQTEICADGQCSLPCTIKANCEELSGTYCADDGTCQQEKLQGAQCAADAECQTGHCSRDFVCCDQPCEAVCHSCRKPHTTLPEGECGVYVEPANYADPECPALHTCDSAGMCVVL